MIHLFLPVPHCNYVLIAVFIRESGQNPNTVSFKTPPQAESQDVVIELIIDGNKLLGNRLVFQYKANSIITGLVPKKGILS